jgi:hypothetical protein
MIECASTELLQYFDFIDEHTFAYFTTPTNLTFLNYPIFDQSQILRHNGSK